MKSPRTVIIARPSDGLVTGLRAVCLLLFHVYSRMTGARTSEDLLCRVLVAGDGEDS